MGPELLEQLHVSLINTATNSMQSLSSANSKESEANLKKSAQRSERDLEKVHKNQSWQEQTAEEQLAS